MTAINEESHLMAYLLGELSDAEAAQLEQQYLRDEALHQELLLAEDELIESFLRNELPADKRRRFETYFLVSPIRRERLESARVLLQVIDKETRSAAAGGRAEASPGLASFISRLLAYRAPVSILAASGLLLVAGLALLMLRLQTAKEQLRAERALWLQQQEDLKRQLAEKPSVASSMGELRDSARPSLGNSSPMNRLVSVVLRQGQSREAGELKRVVLSAESQLLIIYLVFPETTNIRTYRATIKTDEGRIVWIQTGLPLSEIDGKPSAALLAESQQLKPGDYVVTLLGTNSAGQEKELADYVLRVIGVM